MTNEQDTTDTPTVSVDTLIRAATERLVAIDEDIAMHREDRTNADTSIRQLRLEQSRLERIVRATRPRKTKAAS